MLEAVNGRGLMIAIACCTISGARQAKVGNADRCCALAGRVRPPGANSARGSLVAFKT